MVTPGAEYEVTGTPIDSVYHQLNITYLVSKWSIKNIESREEVKKIIVPPLEPREMKVQANGLKVL